MAHVLNPYHICGRPRWCSQDQASSWLTLEHWHSISNCQMDSWYFMLLIQIPAKIPGNLLKMAQVHGPQPLIWEMWLEFLAPGFSLAPALVVEVIWLVNQWMKNFSLLLSLCLLKKYLKRIFKKNSVIHSMRKQKYHS